MLIYLHLPITNMVKLLRRFEKDFKKIDAVFREDAGQYLDNLDGIEGSLECSVCGASIDSENIGAIKSSENGIEAACNKITCIKVLNG